MSEWVSEWVCVCVYTKSITVIIIIIYWTISVAAESVAATKDDDRSIDHGDDGGGNLILGHQRPRWPLSFFCQRDHCADDGSSKANYKTGVR